ncbi:hypothetical protein [Phormidium sp. FACHB-1136]|uniref:hypothetical protein n=1 Tax=Phormidium sp. FACHB-1136 TaxID=2692848 RepID=UPI001685D85D|nr:hypothetical protein [Phormidium sp. FACHB-1136]MBD2427504.1 hypothetical protein [Phormidium sp. FACHB-1136]
MTNPSKRDRGVKATEEGAKRLKQAKSQLRQTNGRPITYENLASKAQVSVDTVKRFFRNKDNVDEAFAIAGSAF